MREVLPGDGTLVSLALAGDVGALAGLLERHRAALYATAIGLLRNRDDAYDAVQETSVIALTRLSAVREPDSVGGWLHAVIRNVCLQRLRTAREAPRELIDLPDAGPRPEDIVDQHALREWVWTALDRLHPEDRMAVLLRYFTRCNRYEAIALATGVPVGTVRSRLHRARAQLGGALRRTVDGSPLRIADLEQVRRSEWEQFYAEVHETPVPRTYRELYAPDVDVADSTGRWRGIEAWSAHEREAIALGVRATIVGLVASREFTILEIDFTNPDRAPDHCPPRSTFVHHLSAGRSRQLDIRYV